MPVRTSPPTRTQTQHAVERADELRTTRYPRRNQLRPECDLVMKGGITSGVVYPLAACELARRYRFVNVGGSSAGAIAAAVVAAAEFGQDDGGFARLGELPNIIGADLPKLFKPGPHTRTLHAAVMDLVDPTATTSTKLTGTVRVLLQAQRRRFRSTLAVGEALAALFTLLTVGPPSGLQAVRAAVLFVLLSGIALVVATGRALWHEARISWKGLSEQGFGICVGSAGRDGRPATSDDPGYLTDWLSDRLDTIAGVDRPLTFGDLESRDIHLQVMTTDLTHGRPMSFPFEDGTFMFDPVELGRYFPPKVIDQLLQGQPQATLDGVPLLSPEGRRLHHLPDPAGLPVVVAARLSLSFPGLISAVPLYAVDCSRKEAADRRPVRCWFSDGGITSNFPIHFFDALWPQRPTFALDLRGYHQDDPDSDVYYGAGARQPAVRTIDDPAGFVAAILDTMQYWADNAQATLPGYRDRVVEVHLNDDEGGMHLRMPSDVVAVLAEKGRQAAEALAEGFDFEQHRWTRYLTAMADLQDVTDRMRQVYDQPLPGGQAGYRDVIAAAADAPHERKPIDWPAAAQTRTEDLWAFVDRPKPDFTVDAPIPTGTLRITPRL